MSVFVVYYENRAKKMRPVLTEAEYRQLRDSDRQKATVQAVRQGDDKQKMNLLQMNYSCLPNDDGTLKGTTRMSMTVGMDVDHIAPEQMAEVRDRILAKKDELGLLMLELSARGQGYHLVFGRRFMDGIAEGQMLANQERNLRWASDLLGVPYDKGAKDITRVFFTTTAEDGDLLYLSPSLFDNKTAAPSASVVSGSAVDRTPSAITAHPSEPLTGEAPINATALNAHPSEPPTGAAPINAHNSEPLTYLGIEYSQIIKKWWQLYNDNQPPCPGNRNTLTFELAVNLRHICGFDRDLLNKVIPNYWATDSDTNQTSPLGGEREGLQGSGARSEKLACIDSALAEKRTQMPRRLKEVLSAIRQEALRKSASTYAQNELMDALDNAFEADTLYHYERLPKLPQGVRESVEAAGHALAMPTLVAIAPAIGALATGVRLDVHGKAKGLNLCSFVVGEAASGKDQIDDVLSAWMSELQAESDFYTQQEDEWAAKKNSKKSGTVPQEPIFPVRMLALVNTVPNLAARLAHTDGKHAFSFTPEADNVANRWKRDVNDFSSMLRQAYDESRYDREARSAEAVRVHIEHLRWNVVMCGTQDALYRVFTNYTDGLLSRMAIGRTPDNTFAPLADNPACMTDKLSDQIKQIAHLLPLMTGRVVLPKLEERGRMWLETIRKEALKNDDRVLARLRMRGCVCAQRMTCALWLPKVAEMLIKKYGLSGAELRLKKDPEMWIDMLRRQQGDEMMQLFDIIADYLIDSDLYYFRDRIARAYESQDYQGNVNAMRDRKGRNDSIYERLGEEFTFEQAYQQTIAVKGTSVSRNSIHQMLKNWRKQGLITQVDTNRYKKIC